MKIKLKSFEIRQVHKVYKITHNTIILVGRAINFWTI